MEKGMIEELLEQHMPLLLWHATRMGKPHLLPDGEAMSVCYEVFMKCALLYKSNDELDDMENSIAFGKYLGTSLYYELETARVTSKCHVIYMPINIIRAVNALKGGYVVKFDECVWRKAREALLIEVCAEEALDLEEGAATHDNYKESSALYESIEKLPNLQRRIIQLALQDCDNAEIAESLRIGRTSVYYHYGVAIKKLQQLMGAVDEEG